jgi:two-component system chemotaxis sensor kinase CheA
LLTRLEEAKEAATGAEKQGSKGAEARRSGEDGEQKKVEDLEPQLSPAPQLPNLPTPESPIPVPTPDLQALRRDLHPPTPVLQSGETIRVSIDKLDALMSQFGELLGAKIRVEQRLDEIRQLQAFAAEWQKEWMALRSHYSRLVRNGKNGYDKDVATMIDFVSNNQEQLRTLNTQSNTLYRQFANDSMRMSLIVDELQEEIKRVRMLPLTTITASFGRMVRDLAREQQKQISLTISGGETELDKRVLEQIKDPLIHLLRNAVDHGIETAAERQQAGKPAEGQIVLQASQQGNDVVIMVNDDGCGLDLDAIRMSAVRKGWLSSADAEKLNDADTANLIFNSGLSTSKIITDISGRGVGLDVVRQNVEDLHGTLEVGFKPEQGRTFTLTLPLTLASSRGLLVEAGEQIFALPLSTVERMLHVDRSAIASVEGKEAINYQGKPIALASLVDLLELPQSPRDTDELTVVIVGVAEKRLGLIVDDLVGEQEIVMKSLGKQLAKVGGIGGATVLGSGQVTLVLHTADLVKLAARTQSRAPIVAGTNHKEVDQHKTVLVVDDSITTRTLERNILEAAGYRVKLATDGEEALGMLVSDGLPNLVVSDINMPRLDGFELTSRIKHDDRFAEIPVILVTSLDSPADKARGIEVGADAYIVKSSFDQGNLLETIEQLV